MRVLVPDPHLQHRRVGRLAEQPQQHHLLLERLEHRADRLREVRPEAGEVRGAAEHHPVLVLLDQALQQRRQHAGHGSPLVLGEALGQVGEPAGGVRQPDADGRGVELGAQLGEQAVGHLDAGLDDPLLDPAGAGDQDDEQPGGAQRHQLDVPHARPGQRGVLHDRDLAGQLGQQPHRAGDDVVEVHGAVQEGLDRPALGRRTAA